jgi:hypothetical protein
MTAQILPFRLRATLATARANAEARLSAMSPVQRALAENIVRLMPNYQYEFSDFPKLDPPPPPGLPSAVAAVEAVMARIMAASAQTPCADDRTAVDPPGWVGTEANMRVAPPQSR